jgi:hypothetical protein
MLPEGVVTCTVKNACFIAIAHSQNGTQSMSQRELFRAEGAGYLSQCDRAVFLFLVSDICHDLSQHLFGLARAEKHAKIGADDPAPADHTYLNGVWDQ